VRRILIIRQHDMLGDFLLATPVFRALRSRFPDAYMGVVVRDYFVEAVIRNPYVDEILVVPKNSGQWNLSAIRKLLKAVYKKWDVAIVLNTVSHSLTSDVLAHLSARQCVLGSEAMTFPGCSRNFFYNLLAPYSSQSIHQSERNLDIVRYIGADTDDLSEVMRLEDSEVFSARQRLERLGFVAGRPAVAIHPGAGKLGNRWPVSRFAELARLADEKLHAQIILCWGPEENDLAAVFRSLLDVHPIEIEPTSIRQMAAVFFHCQCLVCNDTGVMHVGAAVGVPLVAVFGPTDPAEWKPVGQRFVGVRGVHGKVEDVTVAQVFSHLEALLTPFLASGQPVGPASS
jgi:heptosyltransferase-2